MDRNAGLGGYPGVAPADSFASMDTKTTSGGWGGSVIASVVGRRKATPEEEAALLSQATAQAMMAAKSMLLSGSSHATVIATARAAAESVLAPRGGGNNSNNHGGPYLSRRKAKQQAQVIASMAFMSAQNASKNANDDMSNFGGGASAVVGSSPANKRIGGGSSSIAGDSSFRPPSVIRRDFRQDDPSTMGSHMTGVSHGDDSNDNSSRMSRSLKQSPARFLAKHEPHSRKQQHQHYPQQMSADASVASRSSSRRGARVAELLSASPPKTKVTTETNAPKDSGFDHDHGKSYSASVDTDGDEGVLHNDSSSSDDIHSHESYSSSSDNSLAFSKAKCEAGSYEEDAIETFLQPLFCNFGIVPDKKRIKSAVNDSDERQSQQDSNGEDRQVGSSERQAPEEGTREGSASNSSKTAATTSNGNKSKKSHLDILTSLEVMEKKRSGVSSPRKKRNRSKSQRAMEEMVQKALTPKGTKKAQTSPTKIPPPMPITSVGKMSSYGFSRRIRSALQIRSRSKTGTPGME